ncbi:flagellar basal body-associated FliL family protein [Nisaea sp.]|uniref:flagellar basal body-associated FliL family protein n=1 Tax=Nisaea sp. TaxID=2024842 RepID=UPI0032EF1C9B
MKIVVILVLLLVLAGGGVFGVSMFAPGLLPPVVLEMLGKEVPPRDETVVERPAVTQLIDLEPLSIPIFRDGQVDRFLVLHMLIEVRPGEDFELVNLKKVRIIDAILKYVHALSSLEIRPGVNDRAFLKERLLAKIEEIVGKGVVVELLFQNVFERPLQ